ncbi:DUF7009 family protein [Catalinimonas niigatensis]|uniref:DUF7009 family protein n=1 Tax=Catalinimonas niigatensis TaxID=1397264 RepID=UPI00266717F4|nr:hypothetical protein [Catalinimonas niigatensis]WPP49007.1 hypothetical protein PZB72_20275 [Catalinimonas niigatensis]
MKLRIKGNSIRLRLTQTEVAAIGRGSAISETLSFGAQSPAFHYVLIADERVDSITARFIDHALQVLLPFAHAKLWADADQVSIEKDIDLGEKGSLHVLIEKDFQCLHQRPREDERDNFPNPKANQA